VGLPLLLLLVSVAGAQPQQIFKRTGMVNSIDFDADMIVINDSRYGLPAAVRVYTYDPTLKDMKELRDERRLRDRRVLREGMHIGYSVEGEGGGKRGRLVEVWILPLGSSPAGERSGAR
jgi:hypothetical protein